MYFQRRIFPPAITTILLAGLTIVLATFILTFVTGAFGGGADAAALASLTTGYRDDVDFSLTDTSQPNVISASVVGTPYRLNARGHGGDGMPDFPISGIFTDGTVQVLYQKSIILEK